MHTTGGLRSAEADSAAWEAGRGAITGAAKWGFVFAGLGGVGYGISPIYRGLTIQFKVFIQMSGMIMGACLEADRRVRDFEAQVRMQKRMARERALRQEYDDEYDEPPMQKKPK
ncbi:Uncharacterized protein BP5553_06947 [Venustampulla echinocandica]|uniref:Imidazoleglycerol-phosphate dehydratase n=1 Tax=Venustampulla echinocandica TaxID=2656787 RepID=A0A370TI34_9HELO|nr:Uncharacterized protein BP5553_06947 [Venustampulla echinocandica]RDL35016.1 Uncharacterized protein BP5553_06947 [Venustampulla echinocandica]